jgi:hypothetical protein
MVGSSLARKYLTRAGVNGSGILSSLLEYGINYGCKKFYSEGFCSILYFYPILGLK